jgi:hypothetical protein
VGGRFEEVGDDCGTTENAGGLEGRCQLTKPKDKQEVVGDGESAQQAIGGSGWPVLSESRSMIEWSQPRAKICVVRSMEAKRRSEFQFEMLNISCFFWTYSFAFIQETRTSSSIRTN